MRNIVRTIFFFNFVWLALFATAQAQGACPETITGTPTIAHDYYKQVGGELGLSLRAEDACAFTLDELLAYLGYRGLSAMDLETVDPFLLNPNNQSEYDQLSSFVEDKVAFSENLKLEDLSKKDILAVRYFAPKVSRYNTTDVAVPGWRRLVRLKARPDLHLPANSVDAVSRGIHSAFILYNYVVRPHPQTGYYNSSSIFPEGKSPLAHKFSKTIQVILRRSNPDVTNVSPLIFLTFGGQRHDFGNPKPYTLSFSLKADFDLPHIGNNRNYYVPISCIQCHSPGFRQGSTSATTLQTIYPNARLNYLDTDQWYDAFQNPDYSFLNNGSIDPLIDGGLDQDSIQYNEVFENFKALNREIAAQNLEISATEQDARIEPAYRALELWLSGHEPSNKPLPKKSRVVSGHTNPGVKWKLNNPDEAELLNHLDRYCSRCHVSMFFGIFDRESTLDPTNVFKACSYLKITDLSQFRRMPQGRVATEIDRTRMIELFGKLTNVSACQ